MALVAKTAVLFLLCLCAGATVRAAAPSELKLQVSLDTGVIRVADLWSDAGAKAQTVIGTAPPPGRTITIEAAQLAYIAHLYDVKWRPVSGVERTIVERAGRPLTHQEILAPIRRALVEAGAAPGVTVDLASFVPVIVPPGSRPSLTVMSVSYDAPSERFSAGVAVSAEGMETQTMRVDGRAVDMVAAVVAVRRLEPGDVIAPADVKVMQIPARRLAGPVETDIDQVAGQSPKRAIVAGQPLSATDLGPPTMIQKGATVVVVLETDRMSLASQGVALGSGGRDDVIQVMNPVSRSVVAARIAGPGRAVVLPGSAPVVPPRRVGPSRPEVSN